MPISFLLTWPRRQSKGRIQRGSAFWWRPMLRRNQTQRFAAKQYDVIGLPWIALEVKRVENLSGLGSWWKQTVAATGEGQVPVLLYRRNHGQWRVRMRAATLVGIGKVIRERVGDREVTEVPPRVRMVMDVSLPVFLVWFRQTLLDEMS